MGLSTNQLRIYFFAGYLRLALEKWEDPGPDSWNARFGLSWEVLQSDWIFMVSGIYQWSPIQTAWNLRVFGGGIFRSCPIISHYQPHVYHILSPYESEKKPRFLKEITQEFPNTMFPKQSPNLDISISRRKPPWPPGWRLWAAALGHGSRPCGCWRRLWRRFYRISMGITWDIIGIYRINFVILVGGLEYVD